MKKIVYCVLDSLKIDFVKELSNKTFSWCQKYRYDFYINDSSTIVEVHGKQHYRGGGFSSYHGGKTVEEEIENDNIKLNLALSNGIKNYIIIDASVSDFNFIKTSILQSDLSKIYDLSTIDWNKMVETVSTSLVKSVCIKWASNETISMSEMMSCFHLSDTTISRYLKYGNNIGWCKFDNIISKTPHYDNPYTNDAPNNSSPILCLDNNIYFKSIGLCSKNSEKIFGRHMGTSTITHLLKHKDVKFRKVTYNFEYITKQDFNNAIKLEYECYGSPYKI